MRTLPVWSRSSCRSGSSRLTDASPAQAHRGDTLVLRGLTGGWRPQRVTNRRSGTGSWWQRPASWSPPGRIPPGSPPCRAPETGSHPPAGSPAGPRSAPPPGSHPRQAGSAPGDDKAGLPVKQEVTDRTAGLCLFSHNVSFQFSFHQ